VPPHLLKVALSISVGVTQDRDDQEVYMLTLNSFRTVATAVETSAQWFLSLSKLLTCLIVG